MSTASRRVGLVLSDLYEQDAVQAMISLGNALAAAGRQPVFLIPGESPAMAERLKQQNPVNGANRPEVVTMKEPPFPVEASSDCARSYTTYLWLKERAADWGCVVFPDRRAIGYYSLLARYEGLALSETTLVCMLLGPTAYMRQRRQELPSKVSDLELDFTERQCIALAPVLVCDDAAIPAWLSLEGWHAPGRVIEPPALASLCGGSPALETANAPSESAAPSVTVCVTHHNRFALLRQALDSLYRQDYGNFNVVVVDDGSDALGADAALAELDRDLSSRGWRLHRQENRYLGAARNTAARLAAGEYLVFLDDDNCAAPGMISTYVKVAQRTGADIVTSCMDRFAGQEKPDGATPVLSRYVPLGACAGVGS